ncbi:MAG TPA: hypothetical protein PLN69_05600 [bacterium]|nr:hypothetical protein [bacterium]
MKHFISIFLIAFLCAAGCNKTLVNKQDTSPTAVNEADTITDEVITKISNKVIGHIEISGKLEEIKNRGILRVALPAEKKPFQFLDPEYGIPDGFHPALIYEISRIIGVKPNITIPDDILISTFSSGKWDNEFDMIITDNKKLCAQESSHPFFFSGADNGWKIICTSDSGSFSDAIDEILVYLNETGIFAQLYTGYVKE